MANSAAMVIVSSTRPTNAAAVSTRHSSSARWYSANASAPLAITVRLSAAAGSTHAIGSLPMLSTLTGRVPNVSRTISSPSRTTIWSAIEPVGISRIPDRLSCCGSRAASCLPLTSSESRAPRRASSRAAQTWSIHGTGASERPISSATSVRSTSVAPSPPEASGSAIVVAPIAHSRSHRLLSKPDSSAARTVSIEQWVLKNCLYASWIAWWSSDRL